ncbi:hypothetical protein [Gordonia neofelifaecis]|nr:hypothetical protein [Gordonia neofelifaecis]
MWGIDEHGLIWRDRALASGATEAEIAKAVRGGLITVVGRGVYAPSQSHRDTPGESSREHYRLRSTAVAKELVRADDGRALSHQSAAAVLGLELLAPDTTAVHLVNGRAGGGNVFAHRVVHPGRLEEDDVVVVAGLRVTSPARTAVDVALSLTDFSQILAVFDSALRAGVPREDLERRLAAPRRGVARARYALTLADGRSDNPGESWGRAQMIEGGVPIPALQTEYRLGSGRLAICDYDWDGQVVGEFDGFGKYRRSSLRPGEEPADAVFREKVREDGLRDLDLGVVRWTWEVLRRRRLVAYLAERLPRFGINW